MQLPEVSVPMQTDQTYLKQKMGHLSNYRSLLSCFEHCKRAACASRMMTHHSPLLANVGPTGASYTLQDVKGL